MSDCLSGATMKLPDDDGEPVSRVKINVRVIRQSDN